MNTDDLKLLLRKVEELKALLVFTERTIPFLEDVITFVRDIVPMMEDLRSSVEATAEKLPKASSQLDKVSTATEMATTEILNIVEGMMAKVDQIRSDTGGDHTRLESIQGDCTNIMIALQVQDITAQQIAAVNRLMQSVDEGLSKLMRHFTDVGTERADAGYRSERLDIVFDSTAEYGGAAERQRVADAVVASVGKSAERKRTHQKRKH
jgi:chemotaxis regulatin CheY-phosphate phosphatase CheZ